MCLALLALPEDSDRSGGRGWAEKAEVGMWGQVAGWSEVTGSWTKPGRGSHLSADEENVGLLLCPSPLLIN